MKKVIAIWLALLLTISMVGCGRDDTIQFHDKTFNKTDLSQETVEWLEWYNSLTETEQLSISFIPSDLYKLCGYPSAGETIAVEDTTGFIVNFAGNYSLQHDMILTNDTPNWAITVNNEGSEDIVVEINEDVYQIPGGNTEVISTEEKWEPGTYSVSFSGAGASQMIGNAICVLSHRPSGN